MKLFNPEIPRPTLDNDELRREFLIGWLKTYYADELNEWYDDGDAIADDDIVNIDYFKDLDEKYYLWSDGEGLMENLIRYDGWHMSDWENIQSLDFDSRDFLQAKVEEWIRTNNYSCPFKEGDKVKYRNEIGTIQPITEDYEIRNYTNQGKSIVQFPKHIAENEQLAKNGHSGYVKGQIIEWEKLELVDECEPSES
ncbi:hypothetical protein A4G18_00680 [Pasteurellaceae bacterium Pebbles2]|nr:hypothetical protein [Pasteurellaceae bacterium Pebbles2]